MVFEKNEIIALSDGNKHIVVEAMEYENKFYYYVALVDEEQQAVKDKLEVITTVEENGNTFVRRVRGELGATLTAIFNEKLGI